MLGDASVAISRDVPDFDAEGLAGGRVDVIRNSRAEKDDAPQALLAARRRRTRIVVKIKGVVVGQVDVGALSL